MALEVLRTLLPHGDVGCLINSYIFWDHPITQKKAREERQKVMGSIPSIHRVFTQACADICYIRAKSGSFLIRCYFKKGGRLTKAVRDKLRDGRYVTNEAQIRIYLSPDPYTWSRSVILPLTSSLKIPARRFSEHWSRDQVVTLSLKDTELVYLVSTKTPSRGQRELTNEVLKVKLQALSNLMLV